MRSPAQLQRDSRHLLVQGQRVCDSYAGMECWITAQYGTDGAAVLVKHIRYKGVEYRSHFETWAEFASDVFKGDAP